MWLSRRGFRMRRCAIIFSLENHSMKSAIIASWTRVHYDLICKYCRLVTLQRLEKRYKCNLLFAEINKNWSGLSKINSLFVSPIINVILAFDSMLHFNPYTSFNDWLGGPVVRTSDSWLAVESSPPGHDTAWLFISEIGDRLWRVNCLGDCNHHLAQLNLASLQGR